MILLLTTLQINISGLKNLKKIEIINTLTITSKCIRKEDGSVLEGNLGSAFGGSAWTYVPERNQYYLHLFANSNQI